MENLQNLQNFSECSKYDPKHDDFCFYIVLIGKPIFYSLYIENKKRKLWNTNESTHNWTAGFDIFMENFKVQKYTQWT